MKPVQSLKIKLHFPEYSHWHFGNKKHTPVLLKIHQGKPPDCSDVAAFRWKDGRARQSCGQVSSYLGAKQSILVHKNEGMRVPMAARGYEWMVICELACWDICGVCQCSVGKIGRAMWTEPGSKSWHFSFFLSWDWKDPAEFPESNITREQFSHSYSMTVPSDMWSLLFRKNLTPNYQGGKSQEGLRQQRRLSPWERRCTEPRAR